MGKVRKLGKVSPKVKARRRKAEQRRWAGAEVLLDRRIERYRAMSAQELERRRKERSGRVVEPLHPGPLLKLMVHLAGLVRKA